MSFTLTLLGTDTTYTPGHLDDAYDKAETLSYLSTMIQGDQRPSDSVTEFRNTHVAVVDGPTTLGVEVGDRIARGVEAILEAISRGEENINIIAHSRGAVEAILVAHEIERIQTLLANPPYDPTKLGNSVCKYTKAAMNGEHASKFSDLDLSKVAEHISKVKLSLLNIDPVPGGNYMGITHVSTLAWRDPRFYTVPKIVTEYEQYTYENERTRCFKSIIPKCASPETQMKLHSLPGHHGTGSGNLLDQQRNPVPNGTTKHVQELVIVKIIEFLKKNGVALTPSQQIDDPFKDIISKLFDGDKYSPDFKKQAQALSFELYNQIIENREAYRHFNTTSYPTLGQEQALLKKIWNVVDQRIVHYQAHNDTYLESVVPPVPGGHFLNYEHARIHLNNELGLKDGIALSETINQAIERLENLCRHKKALSDLKEKKIAISDLTNSVIGDKLVTAIDTKEGFALLLDGLGMLIEEVKRPYLQGQFTDLSEREKLYYAVQRAFTEFKALAQEPDNEIAQTIFDTLNSNLEVALNTKRTSLKAEYNELSIKLQGNEFFRVFQNKIQEISANLNNKSDGHNATKYQLDIKLQNTLNAAEALVQSQPSLESLRAFINNELNSYADFYTNLNETELSGLTKDSLELVSLVINEALDDSYNYDLDNLIGEIIQSHNNLEQFKLSLPDFHALNSSLDYKGWEIELEEQRDHLIRLAAQYIVAKQMDLQKDIEPLFKDNEALYNQIQGLAVGLGAKNPLLSLLETNQSHSDALQATIKELELQIANLKKDGVEGHSIKAEIEGQIRVLESQLSELSKENAKNETLIIELHSQVNQSLYNVQATKRENEVLSSNISSLSAENVRLGKKVSELNVAFSAITLRKESQDKLVTELREDSKHQEEVIADNKIKLKEKEAEISQLTEQNKNLNEQVLTLESQLSHAGHQIGDHVEQANVLQSHDKKILDENARLKALLDDDTELQCQILVKTKLVPLTQEYLIHLATEIKQTVEPELYVNKENIPNIINAVNSITQWPSQLLKEKFEKISELYKHLNDKNIEKPSEKVTSFYTKLNDANELFKQHKDPKWQRYVANTVAVIGIVLTGVLPGLIALAIISSATGRSPKFWQTRGEGYADKSRSEIEEHMFSPTPNKGG
ncbi:hypothetical protein [uncultured Legionella sp.]|uniref:hypothetical protein n=1 Tax=uncultured Legionella sp. TaxID=210934 RepID=UPI002603BEC8|nr:hypothetical protein [uncultured Legionella sp.]